MHNQFLIDSQTATSSRQNEIIERIELLEKQVKKLELLIKKNNKKAKQ
jgi:hypothetical protein